eukprot:TRINITY_DN6652_c0_g1_i5.p1 TRINITY_DN6652_c0_g1~~TRINITY_DN6652_c0_g1_i5.p1  ORF type:complete len:485 (-),score=73.85 TRINITY_DN6652_c0_g1_i5:230-1684(-)
MYTKKNTNSGVGVSASQRLQSPSLDQIEDEELQIALAISASEASLHNQPPQQQYSNITQTSYENQRLRERLKQMKEDEKLARELQQAFQQGVNDNIEDISGDEELCRKLQEEENRKAKLGQEQIQGQGQGQARGSGGVVDDPTVCPGCNKKVNRFFPYLNAMGRCWHYNCFCCADCGKPIQSSSGQIMFQFKDGRPYHPECHKRRVHPVCQVCGQYVPKRADGLIQWAEVPFWKDKHCGHHLQDNTPQCSSCQRMQSRTDGKAGEWVQLKDGRHLCGLCSSTMIVDTRDCQQLFDEVVQFFDNYGLTLPEKPPLMLVDQNALNERCEGRPDGPLFHVRGLTMWEQIQIIPAGFNWMPILAGGQNGRISVSAILVVDHMPRLLTGSVLAHELLHAWFKLNNVTELSNDVEEGMCQLMAMLWLESQVLPQGSDEDRLASYFRYKIRTDPTPVYGDGFRAAYEGLQTVNGNLLSLVENVCKKGRFPL